MAGLYVHIPFCKTRCAYCGFYSTTMFELSYNYVDAVCAELELRKDFFCNHRGVINTIYIGGGTPSVLTVSQLKKLTSAIWEYCRYVNNGVGEEGGIREFTVECNPEDVSTDFVAQLRAMGVNRISMGVQTFDDKKLHFLNRRHSSLTAQKAIEVILNSGIKNVSIDLMYGFPNQTIKEWEEDIRLVRRFPIKHLSAYMLHYEEGTAMWRMLQQNKISELEDSVCSQMYYRLKERLEEIGFQQYEISNFSKKHYVSKHNSSYWEGTPYIGIGAAAHSYNKDCRQWNVEDLISYIEALRNRKLACETEWLSEKDRYNEMVMLRLRTMSGLNMQKLTSELGEAYSAYCIQQAQKYINSNDLELKDGVLYLSKKALFISDMVIRDLFML